MMTQRLLAFLAAAVFGLGAASALPNEGKVYTHNARGQVTSIADPAHPEGDATYSYDNNGNRTDKLQGGVVTTYQWDARERLVGVLRDGQPLAKYRYDAAGRRVEKQTLAGAAQLVRFQYSGPWLESESNVIGNTIARYQRAADGRVVSYQRLGTARNVATDALGTPIALLSPDGTAVARYSYDAWGNRKQIEGTEEIPIGHTGYYFDKETGLYYAGTRYYDPAIAAFISEDPVEGDIERPVTQNRYAAFNANPTVYTYPDGRCGLAAMDASECINNVAVANGWSAERTLEEQEFQHEVEVRTAPAKLFNTLTFAIGGPIIRGSLAAGLSAYSATGSVRWGMAVAATRASPLVEPAAQIIADVPGPGTLPAASLPASAARAEAAIVQEAQQARAADSFADDVPQALANLPDPPPRAQLPDDIPPPPVAKSQVVTEDMDLATLELRHSQPVSGPAVSQGNDARRLFVNTIPEDADALRTFDEWRPGMGGSRSKNVLYVVTHEGKLVISPAPRGSARGAWGHVDLARGEPVLAAGEGTYWGGQFNMIDNASGHYLPKGDSARQSALKAFSDAGYKVSESAYVEKAYDFNLRRWVKNGQ